MRRSRFVLLSAIALVAALYASSAQAAVVNWNIDSAQSYVRLTIPDFALPIPGVGNGTIRFRNFNNNNTWVDAGGRSAPVAGTIETVYAGSGDFIKFNPGQANIYAVETHNARPNPAAFDPNNTNGDNPDGQYANTSTAMAAFASRVRASVSILTVDAAQLALRNVSYEINSGVIGGLSGGVGALPGGSSDVGINNMVVYADGLSILGAQPLPDIFDLQTGALTSANPSAGSISNTGGNNRQLTYNVLFTIPLADLLDDTSITAVITVQGVIVANGVWVVPEPSTLAMAGIGCVGLVLTVIRRRRKA